MSKIIQIIDCTKIYQLGKTSVTALNKITLDINREEIVAVVGPSGSGKSTLLNLIGGLDAPTEGKIFIDGEEISEMKEKELSELRRVKIGFIFQTFNLFPVLTAYENVEFPLLLQKIPKHERHQKIVKIISLVGLEKFHNHKPSELSGGQQQRVAIARALVHEPKIVLADEPTANLDSKTAEEIIGLMKEINDKVKVTFVFATHDQRIIKFAHQVINLRDGRIME